MAQTNLPANAPRRELLGLAVGGGLALAGLGAPTEARAAGRSALPASTSVLSGNLDLKSSQAWHLARRVCPAPTSAVVSEITAVGYQAWITQQVNWKKINDDTADKIVSSHLSWSYRTTKQVDKASHGESWRAGKALSISRTLRQIYTKRHLHEAMVDVLGDHLYISADGKAAAFVGWFDHDVLRRYALGRYVDMLMAAVHHPALLVYLDNQLNSKDNPNENLGRELLELHTVGVGNYTEADVQMSAKLLTGHGLDWNTLAYRFSPTDHYVGPLKIMGFTHPNATADQGRDALNAYVRYLATRPSTAKHLCRRLAVRFVSDSPSDALVDALANVYLSNSTSLTAVMRYLLNSDEFKNSVGAKWRRPQELMATMIKVNKPSAKLKLKSTQGKELWSMTGTVQWLLYTQGHQPRMWDTVNGYPDQGTAWTATQNMLANFNAAFARVFWADPEIPVKSWPAALGIAAGMTSTQAATRISQKITGYVWTAADLAVLTELFGSPAHKLTTKQIKDRLPKAVHEVFCSPYFMLR